MPSNDNEIAAERIRTILVAAGYQPARIARTADHGGRIIATAGYIVTPAPPGTGHGPRVQWDQHLTAEQLEAKLDEIREALNAAGLHAEWVEKAWELEVEALHGRPPTGDGEG